jgi:hypothetical protein
MDKMNKSPEKILINGDFLCRTLTGIERYAHEITYRLDNLCSKGEIGIVIPSTVVKIPEYKKLEIIRLRKKTKSNSVWRMLTL